MSRIAIWTSVVLALAASVSAEQFIAFKDGKFMKVEGYEVRGDRVLLRDLAGATFLVAAERIDFPLSAKVTEQMTRKDAEERVRKDAELAARRRHEALENAPRLTLVEASRRFGVDQPGINVPTQATGAEIQPAADVAREEVQPSEAASGASSETGIFKRPALTAAEEDLAALKQRRDELLQTIEKERADINPDPLAASMRDDRLETLQEQLVALTRQVEQAEQRVNELKR